MPKMIQARNVPDRLHEELDRRAPVELDRPMADVIREEGARREAS